MSGAILLTSFSCDQVDATKVHRSGGLLLFLLRRYSARRDRFPAPQEDPRRRCVGASAGLNLRWDNHNLRTEGSRTRSGHLPFFHQAAAIQNQ